MAKNGIIGKGREGILDSHSQTYNPTNNLWVKRDSSIGRFMDKINPRPYGRGCKLGSIHFGITIGGLGETGGNGSNFETESLVALV